MTSTGGASLLIYEKRYSPPSGAVAAALGPHPPKPAMIVGHTDEQPNIETPGEVFGLKKLLPQTLEYDVNFHVMVRFKGRGMREKERERGAEVSGEEMESENACGGFKVFVGGVMGRPITPGQWHHANISHGIPLTSTRVTLSRRISPCMNKPLFSSSFITSFSTLFNALFNNLFNNLLNIRGEEGIPPTHNCISITIVDIPPTHNCNSITIVDIFVKRHAHSIAAAGKKKSTIRVGLQPR